MNFSLKNLFSYIASCFFMIAVVFFICFFQISFVQAQVGEPDYVGSFGGEETGGGTGPGTGGSTGAGTGGGTGPGTGGSTGAGTGGGTGGGGVTNPLSFNSIQAFIAEILRFLVILGIPFIIFMIIYTGFKFVTAQGNPEAIKTAQKMFMYTIIGGMLILGASIIANVIKGTVDSVTLLDQVLQAAAPLFNL